MTYYSLKGLVIKIFQKEIILLLNTISMINSEDPDEMPRKAASHLGLRFLLLFNIWMQ